MFPWEKNPEVPSPDFTLTTITINLSIDEKVILSLPAPQSFSPLDDLFYTVSCYPALYIDREFSRDACHRNVRRGRAASRDFHSYLI